MAQLALAERISGITNFTLAAHENENITRAFAPQFINCIENSLQLIALGVVGVFNNWAIAHFNRICPAGNFDNRRVIEVAREALRIDCR
ncbi:hypothetical protein D3C86_1733080 [compost metagenome]